MKTLLIAFLTSAVFTSAEDLLKGLYKRGLASSLNYGYVPPNTLGHGYLGGLHTYGIANNFAGFGQIADYYGIDALSQSAKSGFVLGNNYGYPAGFDILTTNLNLGPAYDQNLLHKHLNSFDVTKISYDPNIEFLANNNFKEALAANNKINSAPSVDPSGGVPNGNSYYTGIGLGGYGANEGKFVQPPPVQYTASPDNQNGGSGPSQPPLAVGSGALGITRLSNGNYAIGSGSLGYAGASITPAPTITTAVAVTPSPKFNSNRFSVPNQYFNGY